MYEKYAALRDAAGYTDYRVAKETQIPKSVFSEWKQNRSAPKIDKLYKICKLFGVDLEYFAKTEADT